MANPDNPLPGLRQLIERRLDLLRSLAESLESGTPALLGNDAETIARGAAHQAELCRQWGRMERELRRLHPPGPRSAGGSQAILQKTLPPTNRPPINFVTHLSNDPAAILAAKADASLEPESSALRAPDSESSNEEPAEFDHRRAESEFEALTARIHHITRVHASLLRHLERSLAVLCRVAEGCAPTYSPIAAFPPAPSDWPFSEAALMRAGGQLASAAARPSGGGEP